MTKIEIIVIISCHGNLRGILWRNGVEPCQVREEAALRHSLRVYDLTSLVFMAFFINGGQIMYKVYKFDEIKNELVKLHEIDPNFIDDKNGDYFCIKDEDEIIGYALVKIIVFFKPACPDITYLCSASKSCKSEKSNVEISIFISPSILLIFITPFTSP